MLKRLAFNFSKSRKNVLLHLLVLVLFFFTAYYYMGPSVTNCSGTVYGFGDNTAGPIWRFSASPDKPLWGFTDKTNFPVGEDLYSPIHFSGLIQYTWYWVMAKFVGPVCGYNLVNIIGFTLSAFVMYGFMLTMTRKRSIAILAGYAVSFSPYYQMKVGGHPSYGYQFLLIGLAWSFFNLVKKKRIKDAVILGTLLAVNFYFDPYFSILAFSVIFPLVLTWLILVWKKKIDKNSIKKQFKLLLSSFGVFLILILPLVTILLANAKEINKDVTAVRGNVLYEAKACSNLPHEYVLPFVLHPVFGRILGKEEYSALVDNLHNGFTCGIGEDTVGVSITIVSITSVGGIILIWEKVNKRKLKLKLGYNSRLVLVGISLVGVTAALLALPPMKVFGVPSPTYLLLTITTTWRTLTRFYVVVNFAYVALFSVVLLYAYQVLKNHQKLTKALFICLFFLIFVEYQAFRPFAGNKLSTYNYSKDTPSVYKWLGTQQDIDVVAEYPIEKAGGESNAMAYYLSMQTMHNKQLFNSNSPLVEEELLRASLKDVSDSQTLSVLSAIGVNAVVIHGVAEKDVAEIKGLEILHVEPQAPFNILAFTPLVKNDITIIAKITAEPAKSMMKFDKGFARNTTIIKSAADWSYEALNEFVITVSPIPGEHKLPEGDIKNCFSISLASNGDQIKDKATISTEKGDIQTFDITNEYQEVSVNSREKITIRNEKGYNFRIKDLGCK